MHHEETTFEALSLAELDLVVGGNASGGRGNDILLAGDGNDTLIYPSPAQFRVKIKHNI